jgi:aminoglycoside 3-N-acetyltransferase
VSDRSVLTALQLAQGLADLGVRPGDVLLVHCSVRSFGHVVGGVQAVYQGLRAAVGDYGTLVVPAFTPQLCHPATWSAPDLLHADTDAAAAAMPLFDPRCTPVSRGMGALPELVRTLPGACRSAHPHTSFAAHGPHAEDLLCDHPDAYRLSSSGPLGRLWQADAQVLMLGTPWHKCTALHLAEYAAPYPGRRAGLWALPKAGPAGTRWYEVPELLFWEGDFDVLGDAYTAAGGPLCTVGIGDAQVRLVPLRPLVQFAVDWLPLHRDLRRGVAPPGWRAVADVPDPLPVPDLEVA